MKPNRLRLFFALTLFLLWISYLGFLVSQTTRGTDGKPVRISLPQFLSSELDVIVELNNQENTIIARVSEVLFSSLNDKTPKVGDTIIINNLEPPETLRNKKNTWLVPLRSTDSQKSYEISPIPASPGFSGRTLKIYPALDGVLLQYKKLPKP
ncbi:MAG: hypothetical protein EBT92_01800 [Planctomycetes bacterium]|nr:hypothetical protein [Planctomycetota bacterium]NBY03691.1 hypothetical protein [Planctomycetota bacterium]